MSLRFAEERLSQRGWVTEPILDLDRSPFYDWKQLRLLEWVYHLFEQGFVDAIHG